MNKFYAIFASALIVSTSAVARVQMEEEGARATRTVRVVDSSFLEGCLVGDEEDTVGDEENTKK